MAFVTWLITFVHALANRRKKKDDANRAKVAIQGSKFDLRTHVQLEPQITVLEQSKSNRRVLFNQWSNLQIRRLRERCFNNVFVNSSVHQTNSRTNWFSEQISFVLFKHSSNRALCWKKAKTRPTHQIMLVVLVVIKKNTLLEIRRDKSNWTSEKTRPTN